MKTLSNFLFKQIDNTPMIMWRIILGLVLFFETAGAIVIGWVKEVYVDPQFTFSFIGFEWLQPLPGWGMYFYFGVLALLAIAITLGYKYRISIILFTLGWLGVYLMHKTSYNNHHYLITLFVGLMCFMPLNASLSLDAKRKPSIKSSTIFNYHWLLFIATFLIVFTYAAFAKIYPDWIKGVPLQQWLSYKTDHFLVGPLYQHKATAIIMAWGGIIFDLLVIPALLFKPTRKIAFALSVFFHISNSITFQIGTFPYMMIGASVLFFSGDTLRNIFRINKETQRKLIDPTPSYKTVVSSLFILFITIQFALPIRHYAIPGNVFWTEEGHRLSWRMMLRSKSGRSSFKIIKPDGNTVWREARKDMTPKQYRTMCTHPDMIWQYCQYLKSVYGNNCEIYVDSELSLNFRKHQPLIKKEFNMAKAEWHLFKHEEWLTKGPRW